METKKIYFKVEVEVTYKKGDLKESLVESKKMLKSTSIGGTKGSIKVKKVIRII